MTPKSDCNTYDCLLSEFGDRFLSAGRVISDEQATRTILGWSWEQWRGCRTSQRQPTWHHQHGKGEVLSFFKLGTTLETERKSYYHSCSSPQSTHDTSYNMLNLIKLTLCCKLLSTHNIPQKPRMAKPVKIKGNETAAQSNQCSTQNPRKCITSTSDVAVIGRACCVHYSVGWPLGGVHDRRGRHYVWRASWSFWESRSYVWNDKVCSRCFGPLRLREKCIIFSWLGCDYLTQMCSQEDKQTAIGESRGLEYTDSLNKDVRHDVVEVPWESSCLNQCIPQDFCSRSY